MRHLVGKGKYIRYLLLVQFFAWIEEFLTQILAPFGHAAPGEDFPNLWEGSFGITWGFLVYGLIALLVAWLTDKLIRSPYEPLVFYVIIGVIGTLAEIFVIGSSTGFVPNIFILIPGLLVLFSWYGSVAMAPRLILDPTPGLKELKRRFWRTFLILMALAYLAMGIAIVASIRTHAQGVRGLVLLLMPVSIGWTFIPLNYYYYKYCKFLVHKEKKQV